MELDELRKLFLFEALPDERIEAICEVGEDIIFTDGDELFHEGQPADFWWILIEGNVQLVRRAGRESPVVIMTMENPGQWAGGFQAWNAGGNYMATGRGSGSGRMFRVAADDLGRFARQWFPFSVHLIEGFFQTVRSMDMLTRHRESMVALGTLAAGLAHELNNPAAASARAVDALRETCDTLLSSLTQLAEHSLSAEQFIALDSMRRELDATAAVADSLETMDREDALTGWLEGRGIDGAWRIAPALAAADVDIDWCERAAAPLEDEHLDSAFTWVASALSARALLAEIKHSTSRISALLNDFKSYSQLDRANVQTIDVTNGLDDTLVMLKHKLTDGVTIKREYGKDVPKIDAFPAELNQVWTNLIANAIDAVDGHGTICIRTRAETEFIVVEVVDDGPGMPPDVQARAFEPFFTTKDVGKGTGLGLDISRRIIADRHHGQIIITSEPGNTVVSVRVPRTVGND
jgi:signal transduction histidine kinase